MAVRGAFERGVSLLCSISYSAWDFRYSGDNLLAVGGCFQFSPEAGLVAPKLKQVETGVRCKERTARKKILWSFSGFPPLMLGIVLCPEAIVRERVDTRLYSAELLLPRLV